MGKAKRRRRAPDAWSAFVERQPEWLRPPLFGATFLFVIVGVRMVIGLPVIAFFLYRDGFGLVGQVVLVLLLVTIAGGTSGLMYSIARPILKPLGRPGGYLMGILCVAGYLLPLLLFLPAVLPPDDKRTFDLHDPIAQVVWLSMSILFGVILGHSAFAAQFAARSE
jgi:hypothetical protein